ncbi:MAG: sensor histidine kinase [Caulobacteraceae bacterium]
MKDGLTDNLPSAVTEDHEGDIWVGTAQGLDRFSPANVVTEHGVRLQGRESDISASNDAVYVAGGHVSPLPGGPDANDYLYRIGAGAPERLPGHAIASMVLNATGDKGVLFGSGHPLLRFRGRAKTDVALPKEANNARVMSAAEQGNDLWVAVEGHGVLRNRGGIWTPFATSGLSKDDSLGLRFELQGSLWIIGLRSGVMDRVTGDHVDEYHAAANPNVTEVVVFTPEPNGVLFNMAGGVSWFDGHSFHPLRHDQAPYFTEVTGIVQDDVGSSWFHTSNGIYRVATRQLQRAFLDPTVRLDAQVFDAHDGLTSTGIQGNYPGTAVRGPDGRLWFLNVSSLAWIDPHHLYRNLTPPPVVIRGITAAGRVFDNLGAIKLPPGASNLQIDYTALSLQDPDRVRIRYRLEGVDSTWIDAGARREAFYTRLGPGRYRFQVIAANNDGVWNADGATLQFQIPPTFVQTPIFLALCLALVGLALWLVYALRIQRLSAAIHARLEERIDERERIARELHDTLLQGFQSLVLRLQGVMEGLPSEAGAQKELRLILNRADEVITTGRKRVQDLRTLVRQGDLVAALTDAAETMAATSTTRFQLTVEGAPRGLQTVVGEELAAIGREAIANAFRHARATTINARLIYSWRSLTLRIADDGVGAPIDVLMTGRPGHFGLIGMRERADKIDATLVVSGTPSGGVEVSVTVPAGVAFAVDPNASGKLLRAPGTLGLFIRRFWRR